MNVGWRLMEQVLDLRLPDEQERILVRMARRADEDGTRCFAGLSWLAEQTGRSPRTVQRVMRALEGAGLIVPAANKAGGRGLQAAWNVTIPPVGQSAATIAKGVTGVTVSEGQRVSPVTPITAERVSPVTPFTEKRVTPVTEKGDTGDTPLSPLLPHTPTTPLNPPEPDPNHAPDTATFAVEAAVVAAGAAKSAAASDPAAILRGLTPEARQIVDWHRECHGSKRPVKLNPTQARQLEEAVADLGVERLREGVQYMAGEGVRELSKAIRAARTKRQRDESGASPASYRNGGFPAPTTPRPGSLAARTKSERFGG